MPNPSRHQPQDSVTALTLKGLVTQILKAENIPPNSPITAELTAMRRYKFDRSGNLYVATRITQEQK